MCEKSNVDTNMQIETHLSQITFISTDFDYKALVQKLKNEFDDCQLFKIKNASDRVQFDTLNMLPCSDQQLNQSDFASKTEAQLVVNMINTSPTSIEWIVVKLDDENRDLNIIRTIIRKYDRFMKVNLPNFGPAIRWFAIGFPSNDTKELLHGVINNSCHILFYWLSNSSNDDMQHVSPIIKLTAREHEILNWISEGKTSQEVSSVLGISPKTVNLHAENIIRKLNASNRTNAVVRAISLGLI